MPFLTFDAARSAAPDRTTGMARESLRKSAGAPLNQLYDVFLSHTIKDALVIKGIKTILERSGLTVYVDWIDDPELNRASVNAATAEHLRTRMKHCRSLIFATSDSSPNSKWMPWELGFFDGLRGNHIAILPVTHTRDAVFYGQEYLGLYPVLQDLDSVRPRLEIPIQGSSALSVRDLQNKAVWLTVS